MKDKFNGSKLRWLIARILDKLPDTCWADLVMWATYPKLHDFSEILDIRGTAGVCHRMGEYNYCGKCNRRYPENAFEAWMKAQQVEVSGTTDEPLES